LGTETNWLLGWEELLLFDLFIIKEIVITYKFFLVIGLLDDPSVILFFSVFTLSVEVANEMGKHFLIEIINSKFMIVNPLFFPPFDVFFSSIVILGIEWVELDAFGGL